MSLNAPKSERNSKHYLESTQSEVHKTVVKPSAESARVVRGRGAVTLQMSVRTFTETCAEKLRKTLEPRKQLVSGTVCMYLPKQYFTFCLKSITIVGHSATCPMVVQSRHPITYCTN